jgi:hypothetical protein
MLIDVRLQSRLDLEEEIHIVKAHFRPNMVSVRSTCLCPQLEANRLHPFLGVKRLCGWGWAAAV